MKKYKKSFLVFFVAALFVLAFSGSAFAKTFPDVPTNNWAYTYVNGLSDLGIISGYPDGAFYPNAYITRAEVATMVSMYFYDTAKENITGGDFAAFTDVQSGQWFYNVVANCAYNQRKIVSGYVTNGVYTFKPNNNISRQECAAIVYRMLNLVNETSAKTFADNSEIGDWAKNNVYTLTNIGIINGYPEDNTFRPQNYITRAEFATMFYQAVCALSDVRISVTNDIVGAATVSGTDIDLASIDNIAGVFYGIADEKETAYQNAFSGPEVRATYYDGINAFGSADPTAWANFVDQHFSAINDYAGDGINLKNVMKDKTSFVRDLRVNTSYTLTFIADNHNYTYSIYRTLSSH